MAWVDGELEGEDARRFEARLAREPALAREVSELRALELVARQMAPPEPMDHEWARIDADPAQRLATGLGFALALVGAVGLWVWLAVALATSEVDLVPKVLTLAVAGGLALVFLTVLRRRLSTLPFDPYTRIKR
jgi:anti-sigma factor RsiW